MAGLMRTSDVVYRKDLYPRDFHFPELVQKYALNIEMLPAIEVNQHNILIDGWHRWTAHRQEEIEDIKCFVTETSSERELLRLSCERNNTGVKELSESSKRNMAIRLYDSGLGFPKDVIAKTLSVTQRSVTSYLTDIDKGLRKKRKQKIFDMYLACYTQDEIAKEVGIVKGGVNEEIRLCSDLEELPKMNKLHAFFNDPEFKPPIYNVWTFAKKTNAVKHPGNSEQRILENLLSLYTESFDIVVDPFAGGGSTIDVCKKRLRRYWVSDLTPITAREDEIRQMDISVSVPPLNRRWADVSLTYLDPPYWKQVEGEYSDKDEDFANMELDDFRKSVVKVIKSVAQKQSRGVIALLMQPTQWKAPDKLFTDHVFDIVNGVNTSRNIILENRISVPYSTEQCNPQMVEWAQTNKKLLVISRELVIWRVLPKKG